MWPQRLSVQVRSLTPKENVGESRTSFWSLGSFLLFGALIDHSKHVQSVTPTKVGVTVLINLLVYRKLPVLCQTIWLAGSTGFGRMAAGTELISESRQVFLRADRHQCVPDLQDIPGRGIVDHFAVTSFDRHNDKIIQTANPGMHGFILSSGLPRSSGQDHSKST